MGNCASNDSGLSPEEKKRKELIEKQLKEDSKQIKLTTKILLLGTGESGKSTIAKQMKILHLEGFKEDEKTTFKANIFKNILDSMIQLIRGIQSDNELSKIDEEKKAFVDLFLDDGILREQTLTPSIITAIKELWSLEYVKEKLLNDGPLFQIIDSASYLFDNIDRIASPGYTPVDQDILRARAKTTGIAEINFDIGPQHFIMVDVGGQRSERRKWIHCFQDVNVIMFCSAISEYDQLLYEDRTANRIQESLLLFQDICESKWFQKTSIVLFLNKRDIFEEKIKKSNLTICFPEYAGGTDFQTASSFVKEKFSSLNKDTTAKHVYAHLTTATDTSNVRFVFSAVQDMILHEALDASGF
eukprot:TRINITY_DN219_c1_g1_i2.p1 TRINITY_DN219_c1_g1~~TRINITY_DN219_c1_g1_i2.p1  ORF type:complete len:358 (-),score=139.95 TRINITY_DN219_c1_g1_i2:119-1192(-)